MLALSCAIATPRASAQTAQFVFAPIGSTAGAPGATLQFSINLVFTAGGLIDDLFGLTYYLQQNTPAGAPFAFTLSTRDVTGSLFNTLITPTLTANQPLNPRNAQDLGAIDTTPQPNGTYFIANITLKIAAGTPNGLYVVGSSTTGPTASVVADSNGDTFAISPGTIQFNVVPEPSTYALLAGGSVAFVVYAVRRRKVSA